MMNKQSLLFSLLFFCLLALSPTGFAAQNTLLDPFDEIRASGRVNIRLEPAEGGAVNIPEEEDQVSVEVRSGILYVKRKDRWKPRNYKKGIDVVVSYQKLRRITGEAGAEVSSSFPLVTADGLRLSFGSGAKADLEVKLEDLEVNVGEGAELELRGYTDELTARASTGGILEAFGLQSKRTYVRANTGGEAEVMATEHLEANANTGGNISYRGNPNKTFLSSELGGDIDGSGL